MFKRATKQQSRLRLALIGPSGSGKTFTALRIGCALGTRVAVIDTERGSASKYSDKFHFDVAELPSFDPRQYVQATHAAEAAGYEVLIIDSLSHAWMGKEGALEQVDKIAKRSQSGNSFAAWRDVTPLHNALVDALLQSSMHLIVTMRAKTEYVLEPGTNGKITPKKIGLAPVQRDGVEYEFDIVGDMTLDHDLIVSKTRCEALDGAVITKPDARLAETIRVWLTDGVIPHEETLFTPSSPHPTEHRRGAVEVAEIPDPEFDRQKRQQRRDLEAALKDARERLKAEGGKPRSLGQAQVVGMTMDELQAELESTLALLRPVAA